MPQAAVKPVPAVEAPCIVCGTDRHVTVCSAREIEAQRSSLHRFHRRRLRPGSTGRMAESAVEDRVSFTQDYVTDIVACLSCGLLFRNPRPHRSDVLAAYAADRYAPDYLERAFEMQRDLFRAKARVLADWLPRRKRVRIVEVGSYVCGFLAAGLEEDWEVIGVDPGEQTAAFCQAKGLTVHRGTMADLHLAAESVDGVTIWNTFDQLPDPHPTLQAAQAALRPDGLLAIRVPNGACFAAAMAAERRLPRRASGWLRAALAWNNLLTFPYLVGYSVTTADRLLSRYGFRRIALEPDTLVKLDDLHLKWWAVLEERTVKAACRLVSHAEAAVRRTACVTAPWLDLYYRKTSSGA